MSNPLAQGLSEALGHLDEIKALKADNERLRHENEEYERLFNINWDADQRAIKRWQEAHPGNDLVWPDRADMVVWLLEQTPEKGSRDV